MQIKSVFFTSCLTVLATLFLAHAASAATISYAYDPISLDLDSSASPSGPDAEISATFLFPQFDPTSGTLTSVDMSMSGDLRFTFAGTSVGAGQTGYISGAYMYSAYVNHIRLGGIHSAFSDQCYAPSPSSCSVDGVRTRNISDNTSASTELDSFIGSETIDYNVVFGFEFFSLTNLASAGGVLTSDNLRFEVTYNYEELPAVPLPASGLLLAASVLTLLRRKSRAQRVS